MSNTTDSSSWQRAFNSPLEAGMRSLAVLLEAYPAGLDLNRLLYFDYLLVHSGDVPDGPESLHPATPLRSGELLVRRSLVEQALRLLASRGLIECDFTSDGIAYTAAEPAASFLHGLEAAYTVRMRKTAEWVVQSFASYSEQELRTFISRNLDRWGAEFESESVIREVPEWLS